MLKPQELSNPESCLNRARDDEYLFVLLSRDRAMPETIHFWVNERVRLGKNKIDDPQIQEAIALAHKVRRLQETTKTQAEAKAPEVVIATDYEQRLLGMCDLQTLKKAYDDPIATCEDEVQNQRNMRFHTLIGNEIYLRTLQEPQ